MQNMETRYTHSPEDIRHYSTEQLRKEFLVEKVFIPGEISLTYTHNDRMIFGGEKEEMKKQDGYYIGKETRHVVFSSEDPKNPAKFYISSVPAHHKYPNVKISIDNIKPMETGEPLTLNQRKIYQYIHPNVCESCQLQMGYTILEPGSAWNTMPSHTHERRMEAYVYFDMEEDTRIFHMMGKPDETKHLVISSEQAAISPSWSIHSGVGTSNYSFIWAMCGENITYTDMDMIPMDKLK